MNLIDYIIILVYFIVVIGVGVWYKRRAARNLDSYFLAGKSLHWLALAMSGSVATFDITGTMWIVTLLVLFGMKSMWNHWMWGFLMAAFFMAYMGKWVRRSRVMTGAEWMVTRFGDGPDGKTARIAYTAMAVIMLTGFTGYAFQGIGRFGAVYIDLGLDQTTTIRICAFSVFAITTLYVLFGGQYGVVITNVIQTIILMLASILIAAVAYMQVTPSLLADVKPVDGLSFTSLMPVWRIQNVDSLPEVYRGYEMFGALTLVWVFKGFLLNLGGPGQMTDFQSFLSARSPRDAAKLGAAWSGFLIVRWAMCMGIALLALTGLVNATDPEQIMPIVLQKYLWPGIRGLVIAGLLAAFMSTFSATVNAAASYIVRDIWQPLVYPYASQKHLVRASYIATVMVVVVGILLGLLANSIREIWDWLMISLGAAFVIPNVLRWYWWRMNGWGYAAGTLAGLVAALPILLLELCFDVHPPLYFVFPAICAVSLAVCLFGTLLTRPTSTAILLGFFESVRPFGLWAPICRQSTLSTEKLRAPGESMSLAAVNVVLSSVVILGVYIGPMYLVGHWYHETAVCLVCAAFAATLLFFTWFRNLPEDAP